MYFDLEWDVDRWSHEARLTSKGDGPLTWIVGAFFEETESRQIAFGGVEGIQHGGANTNSADDNIPDTYRPNMIDSYEIGWKSTLGDGRVTCNGAVYLMKWKDFQTNIYDPDVSVVNFIANVGDAETKGFEFDLQAYLTENLAIQVAATHNDGELKERFQASESAFAEKGQRLPLVSKWKTFVNARNQWQQGPTTLGYAQATYSYTGDSWNQLVTAGYVEFAPQRQASCDTMDARLGWVFKDGRYGVELFATNLFDKQAQIFIITAQADQRITTIRPRTFGLRLRTRFD